MTAQGSVRPAAAGSTSRAILLVPLVSLLWGLNWPAMKVVLDAVGPWTLRSFGMTLAAVLVGIAARALGRSLVVPRRHWGRVIVSGIFSIVFTNLGSAVAQTMGPTGRTAAVMFTMPLWATLFAWLLLGERVDTRRWIGLGLGLSGLACLALPLILAGTINAGLGIALFSGMSWAAGIVIVKRWPIDADVAAAAAWQLLIGGVIATIGMVVFERPPDVSAMPSVALWAFAYHVIVSMAFCYVLWFEIAVRVPAGLLAVGSLMIPAVGMGSAALLVHDIPTVTDVIGLVLVTCGAGVVLVRRWPAPGR